MSNATAQSLIREIERSADHLLERGFNPHHHIPTLTIIEDEQARDPAKIQVQVVCRQGVTVGMIVMPADWSHPPDTGQKLVVPPDEDGWGMLDALLSAGVTEIHFWAVD